MPKIQIPKKLDFLFQPARYKIGYGGRGSAKSWSIAKALIVKLTQEPKRWLCCREIQNSIDESVHRLIADQIREMGYDKIWHVDKRHIRCDNGSEFIFEGLFRNVDKIKSLEGLDGAWVEEAHNVSKDSWELLLPTVRKDNSEIWVSFNPKFEDDDTYQRWVINPPDGCISVEVNYHDNPWFPGVLRKEMEQDKARDRVLYEHKWLGKPVGTGGRVFPAFDKKVHIREFNRQVIAETGNCFMAMDPHSHYYPFCVWLAVIPKNKRMRWPEDFYKHVYAEWPTFDDLGGYYWELRKKLFYNGTLADMARELYATDGIDHGIRIEKRFIDTRFAKGAGGSNWSTATSGIVHEFAKQDNGGLKFELPWEKHIDIQREVIRSDMLYNVHAPVSEFNEPSFSVDPACKNVIVSLANHRLEEEQKGDGSREKESDKFKDPCDAVRICYAGLNDFKYKKPGQDAEGLSSLLSMPQTGSWMR
jgi:phage terminase large subunit